MKLKNNNKQLHDKANIKQHCLMLDSKSDILHLEQTRYHSVIEAAEWTVPQLSIMIIYNSTWSILIQ